MKSLLRTKHQKRVASFFLIALIIFRPHHLRSNPAIVGPIIVGAEVVAPRIADIVELVSLIYCLSLGGAENLYDDYVNAQKERDAVAHAQLLRYRRAHPDKNDLMGRHINTLIRNHIDSLTKPIEERLPALIERLSAQQAAQSSTPAQPHSPTQEVPASVSADLEQSTPLSSDQTTANNPCQPVQQAAPSFENAETKPSTAAHAPDNTAAQQDAPNTTLEIKGSAATQNVTLQATSATTSIPLEKEATSTPDTTTQTNAQKAPATTPSMSTRPSLANRIKEAVKDFLSQGSFRFEVREHRPNPASQRYEQQRAAVQFANMVFQNECLNNPDLAQFHRTFLERVQSILFTAFGTAAPSFNQRLAYLAFLKMTWPQELPRGNSSYLMLNNVKYDLQQLLFEANGNPKIFKTWDEQVTVAKSIARVLCNYILFIYQGLPVDSIIQQLDQHFKIPYLQEAFQEIVDYEQSSFRSIRFLGHFCKEMAQEIATFWTHDI